jgi:hypothetical protein
MIVAAVLFRGTEGAKSPKLRYLLGERASPPPAAPGSARTAVQDVPDVERERRSSVASGESSLARVSEPSSASFARHVGAVILS